MREKRRHHRAVVELGVALELPDGSSYPGTATDVSMGGMFVETAEPPDFGTKATIVCVLDQVGAPARIDSVVRWTKPGGVGLQFGLLGAGVTHALAEFIARAGRGAT